MIRYSLAIVFLNDRSHHTNPVIDEYTEATSTPVRDRWSNAAASALAFFEIMMLNNFPNYIALLLKEDDVIQKS